MPSSIRPWAIALFAASSAIGTSHAHQVWIEASGNQARLQFGEYADNLIEKSPGALDKFQGVPVLQAQKSGAAAARLEGQRTATAFTYALPNAAETLFAEATYPVIDRSKGGQPALLWRPAARWVPGLAQAVAATAPLDVVPTGRAGELRVVFNGQPLPKAQVTLVAPSGWAREATTGADGTVQFALPWRGQYVAEVKHADKTPGERAGEKFGETSYLTTLTFAQADGAESPALPAAPTR
ncbi:DUF4198 domain-containing protein [Acidovorax sp. GBBC 3334]|uniref:DUF4198 domain-containing protein n=1 Tax=Acidovorax sp. GBBC 3334 TaxID=2940496 RepID=UPI002302059E|nr:DUF4198 domain-containing protein [Acidovorax sp. GBBC 3334]MDA8457021.1 DUF4198 domain-containing protein [Acidovorax sp. GBBC 3334]